MRNKNTVKTPLAGVVPRPAAIVQPTHEQTMRRAQALWESYGKPVGRDEEIWLEAELQLRGSMSAATSVEGDSPLVGEPREVESATEKIQHLGDAPRGTEQLLR